VQIFKVHPGLHIQATAGLSHCRERSPTLVCKRVGLRA
jgi:hypothetical protein